MIFDRRHSGQFCLSVGLSPFNPTHHHHTAVIYHCTPRVCARTDAKCLLALGCSNSLTRHSSAYISIFGRVFRVKQISFKYSMIPVVWLHSCNRPSVVHRQLAPTPLSEKKFLRIPVIPFQLKLNNP